MSKKSYVTLRLVESSRLDGILHTIKDISYRGGHWEFDSICPVCGGRNHVQGPVGERVVQVVCGHCRQQHEYTHIVRDCVLVEDATADAGAEEQADGTETQEAD